MSQYDAGSPTLQVSIYKRGELIEQVLCETPEEAAEVAAEWGEQEYTCEVEDLAEAHSPDDVLAPEPEDFLAEDEHRAGP